MKKLRLGILGASSLLANDVLAWLVKWHFPYEDIYLYDMKEYCGTIISCSDKYRTIQEADESKLASLAICFICDEVVYERYIEQIKQVTYCINLTQYHQDEILALPPISLPNIMEADTRLWIPSAALCMALHILSIAHEKGNMISVDLTSMHSAGELGVKGATELQEQVFAYASHQELEVAIFPLPSATQHLPLLFQVLPQTSTMLESGESQEEAQLQAIIKDVIKEDIAIFSTCVRIPSLRGLAFSLHIHFKDEVQLDSLMDAYASSSSCICFDDKEHNMYPILADVLHDYHIYIGRMRSNSPHDFSAWSVCDDLSIRSGAAVQTAFYLYHNFFNKM